MGEPKVRLTWEQLSFMEAQLEGLKRSRIPVSPDKDHVLAYYRDGINDSIAMLYRIAKGQV